MKSASAKPAPSIQNLTVKRPYLTQREIDRLMDRPHMLRHACGFKLANDGHDTRALQHYLGHKNIQHTVRYTEMAPDRFKDFWRD
jgi:site-specific recombinase XerD